jgi:hypothetical protein
LQSHNYRNEYLLSYSGEVKNLLDDYSSIQKINKEELEIYWTYGTYSPCYSLWFGNDFSKRRYTDEILNQCPNDLQYDIWDETISYTDETGLESLFDEQKNVILVGNRSTIEKYQNQAQVEIIRSLQHNLSFIVYQAPQQ